MTLYEAVGGLELEVEGPLALPGGFVCSLDCVDN